MDNRNICLSDRDSCTGCAACANVCPKGCISMVEDNEGFRYPVIDNDMCVKCGMCQRVCKVKIDRDDSNQVRAYAIRCNDTDLRKKSSSGGLFSLLAEEFLSNGGYVCGAKFDDNYQVGHHCINNIDELDEIRRSKYVQSNIGNSYTEIKKLLTTGNRVMFCGTPCQCEGLAGYLGKKYDNLLLVDFICHGVPSPGVWRRYLESFGKKPTSVNFRDKSNGWKGYLIKIDFEDGSTYERDGADDEYIQGFLWDIYLRPSCYTCNVKGENRASDITIGDFWGINDIEPEINDNLGVSLAIIRSEEGLKQFGIATDGKVLCLEVELEKAIKGNISYSLPTRRSGERASFFRKYQNKQRDLKALICKYVRPNFFGKIRRKIYRVLGDC